MVWSGAEGILLHKINVSLRAKLVSLFIKPNFCRTIFAYLLKCYKMPIYCLKVLLFLMALVFSLIFAKNPISW